MTDSIINILLAPILVSLLLTVYYSFKSRRTEQGRLRGLLTARMNISMGIMLVLISLVQFSFQGSLLRVTFGVVVLLIGLFNLFAGIRNHNHFRQV